jgi:RNA polymerase sigma-70 factor, ECF subfamily
MVEDAALSRPRVTPATSLVELVETHYRRLINLALLICRDPSDAEDAVQTALERAWRHRAAIRDPAKATPWLNQIVVREAIRAHGDRHRLVSRWHTPPREIVIPTGRPDEPDLDLRRALHALSTEQRAAVVLHYYSGYSVAEMADICGIPLETARSRLRLAKTRLRLALGDSNVRD